MFCSERRLVFFNLCFARTWLPDHGVFESSGFCIRAQVGNYLVDLGIGECVAVAVHFRFSSLTGRAAPPQAKSEPFLTVNAPGAAIRAHFGVGLDTEKQGFSGGFYLFAGLHQDQKRLHTPFFRALQKYFSAQPFGIPFYRCARAPTRRRAACLSNLQKKPPG